MASVQDIHVKITEALTVYHTIPCLQCYETSSTLLKLRRYNYDFHVSRYGVHVS